MINAFNINNYIRLPIISLALLFSISSFAEDNNMTEDSLWHFATQLKNSIGMDVQTLDSVVGSPLSRVDPAYGNRLATKPFTLDGGVEISNFIVRLDRRHPGNIFIIHYDVGNACILLEDVKKRYPQLKLTSVPHGQSEDETFNWTTPVDEKGNAIGFGFSQSASLCLKNMVLRNFSD